MVPQATLSHRVVAKEHGKAGSAAILEQVFKCTARIVHESICIHVHKPIKRLAHHLIKFPHAVEHGIWPAAQRSYIFVEHIAMMGSVALVVCSRNIKQRRIVGIRILVDHEPRRP